jgi:hypothetical protein
MQIIINRILFIYGLFNDAVSVPDYTVSKDRIINELERIWYEAIVS